MSKDKLSEIGQAIERAVRNKDVQDDITSTYNYKPIDTFHVSGKISTSKRNDIVNIIEALNNFMLFISNQCAR